MNVLIVDAQAPSRAGLRRLLESLPEAAACRIDEAADAAQAQQLLAAGSCQLLLLDTELPGVDGLQLAAELQRRRAPAALLPALVFVTAQRGHALSAFEHGALDYLLKPVRRERLRRVLLRVAALCGATPAATAAAPACLSVPAHGGLRRIALADVLYFRAERKYTVLRTLQREHLIDATLDALQRTHGARFVRVHRCALVARDAIAALLRGGAARWQVQLLGVPERLPVSRRRLPALRALLR